MPPKKKKKSVTDNESNQSKRRKTSSATTNSPPKLNITQHHSIETITIPQTILQSNTGIDVFLKEPGWLSNIANEFKKDYFKKIDNVISNLEKKPGTVYPPVQLIFNAFNLTPFDEVKVVILGQDPYHDDNQAHGLAFSVPKGIKIPPSLKNMFKELADDIEGFTIPDHGCLEKWASQGVLLLNAALTVEAHEANSHGKKKFGWQTFTDTVIKTISDQLTGVVFILWGNFAKAKETLIDDQKHCVIKAAHPSPLSFNKFFGCKCFSKTNKALLKFGKKQIDWNL